MYTIIRDNSVLEFLENTSELLYCDEPANSLMLGLCEGMVDTPPQESPRLLRILQSGVTVSAAVQTARTNLILTHAEHKALQVMAAYLRNTQAEIPGVVGPSDACDFFADEWTKLTAQKGRLSMGQKIYKLERVHFPRGVPGTLQEVRPEEQETVVEWLTAFAQESLPKAEQRNESRWTEFAKIAIQKRAAHFWIQNGQPVSIAVAHRPTKNGVSVSFVYTPRKFRKNGFASAVVSYLSQKMLDTGKKFCVLYTDLANPTSNKIYQDIGYREVSDSKLILFK